MKSIILNNITYDLERSKKKLTTKLPEWEQDIFLFLVDWFSDTKTVKVQTSGSTGTPKIIERSKDAMTNSASMTGMFLGLSENQSALLNLPAKYIAGKMMLVRAMVWQLRLDYIKPQNNLPALDKEYFFGAMTPSQVNASFSQIRFIKKLIIGGAPIPLELEQKISTITNSSIYSSYGMTETLSHIALRKITKPLNLEYALLPNVDVSTDDRDCLIIKAPLLLEDSIVTNDIVQITSPKSFIWKGRFDHVINSGGIKVFPESIEQKLSTHISLPFYICGIPDSKWGTKVALIIEGKPFNTDQLKIILKTVLQKTEVPKQIYFLPTFIHTENGKLNRIKTSELLDHQ